MFSDPLRNPVWHALNGAHEHLSQGDGPARRYLAEVAPFAATADASPASFAALTALLDPGESLYVFAEDSPSIRASLPRKEFVPCLQMLFPGSQPLPSPDASRFRVLPLDCRNAGEMLELINLAFPGFFRIATCRMGRYWGVRHQDGTLIGMVGERLLVSSAEGRLWPEISGLCRHPTLAPPGVGTTLLAHLLGQHRAEGSRSWLHVTETNTRAIALYERLGFQVSRRIQAHRLHRLEGEPPQW